MMQNTIPWGMQDLNNQELILSLPSDEKLIIRRVENEISLTHNSPAESKVSRFFTGKSNHLFLQPGLPDLPMTLKPADRVSILPGNRMEASIEVPLILSVLYGTQSQKELLTEIPLDYLSRSFFGTPDNGEISYFLESPMYRDPRQYEKQDRSVYCPITIINKSLQKLEFERMILRVPYLSLFFTGDILTSSPVEITFKGQDQISQIAYKKTGGGKKQDPAAPPRQPADKNLLKRSFFFFKTLYTG